MWVNGKGGIDQGMKGKSILFSILPNLFTRHKIVIAYTSIAALRLPDPTDMSIK